MSYTSLAALQKHMNDFQLLESTYRESTEHNYGVNCKCYNLAIKITWKEFRGGRESALKEIISRLLIL